MSEFLKMDVFFAVTTGAVIVLAALLAYAIYRAIRIMHRLEKISETVSEEAELIREDLDEARDEARREGYRIAGVLRGVLGLFEQHSKRRRKR